MVKQLTAIEQAYIQGFIDKCAEYGVDPEELLKHAQLGSLADDLAKLRGLSKRVVSKGVKRSSKPMKWKPIEQRVSEAARFGKSLDPEMVEKARALEDLVARGGFSEPLGKSIGLIGGGGGFGGLSVTRGGFM